MSDGLTMTRRHHFRKATEELSHLSPTSTSRRRDRNRASLALGLVVALIAATFSIGISPAQAANEGTLKIYQTQSNCELDSNDPKILSPYWIGGFNFNPDAYFEVTISTQPGGVLAGSVSGTTNSDGSFCAGPVTTEPGMYKAEITGAGDKSKVFDVAVAPPAEVAVTAPTFTDATCEDLEGSGMTIPADTEEIDYTTTGSAGLGNVVTVTAEPIGNVILTDYPEGGWSHTFASIESLECPIAPTEVAVAVPTFTDATCETPNATAMKIPADTAQIDYTAEPSTAAPGVTVKVTAAPIGNVVLVGYPQGGWSHPFPTIASLNCQVPLPPAAVPTAVTAPIFINATCTAPDATSMTVPTSTSQIAYTTTGTAAPGNKVTVTAAPIGNVVLTGYPTGGWSNDFPTVASLNCAVVDEVEDEVVVEDVVDEDTEESAVAGAEDELAATGGNTTAALLGALLVLSGAALIGSRRRFGMSD